MKKVLLSALIAAMFASSAASAAERELLFGPIEAPKKARPAASKQAVDTSSLPARVATHTPAPVSAPVALAPAPAPKPKRERARAVANAAAPVPVAAPVPAPLAIAPPVRQAAPVQQYVQPAPVVASRAAAPRLMPVPDVQQPAAAVAGHPAYATMGTDAFAERERLSRMYQDSINVGLQPSLTRNQDVDSFMRHFLPLANHMSTQVGALVNMLPERNIALFRKHIAEARYPVIFTSPALVREATRSGYTPVIATADALAPAFLVRKDSKYNSIDDIKGARLVWTRSSITAMLAQAELAKRGVAKQIKVSEGGQDGYSAVLQQLRDGTVDVAVVRDSDVKRLTEDSAGSFKVVGTGLSAPATIVMVRKDLRNDPSVIRLANALFDVTPDVHGPLQRAAASFANGFGVRSEFVLAGDDVSARMTHLLDTAEGGFGSFLGKPLDVSARVREANMARGALSRRVIPAANDPLSVRASYVAKMNEGMNVGFFVPPSSNQDVYQFQSNFVPLANHLTEQSGVLVSLIPERDASGFVRRIGDNQYSAIVIGPSLAHAALQSGYLPVARAGDFVSPGFLVPVDSRIKKIEDLAGKRIATVRISDAATVGRWELLKRKIKDTKFEFFGATSEGPSVLNSGAADAILVRSSEALQMAQTIKGADGKLKYRAVIGTEEVPAVSMWVRHDTYDFPLIRHLSETFRGFNDGGTQSQKLAFEGYVRGFGVRDSWQTSGIEEHTTSVEMIDGLIKAGLSLVGEVKPSLEIQDRNRAKPVTYALVKMAPEKMTVAAARLGFKQH